jgi:hypothetical protein
MRVGSASRGARAYFSVASARLDAIRRGRCGARSALAGGTLFGAGRLLRPEPQPARVRSADSLRIRLIQRRIALSNHGSRSRSYSRQSERASESDRVPSGCFRGEKVSALDRPLKRCVCCLCDVMTDPLRHDEGIGGLANSFSAGGAADRALSQFEEIAACEDSVSYRGPRRKC